MNRILSIIVLLLFVFVFVGCGDEKDISVEAEGVSVEDKMEDLESGSKDEVKDYDYESDQYIEKLDEGDNSEFENDKVLIGEIYSIEQNTIGLKLIEQMGFNVQENSISEEERGQGQGQGQGQNQIQDRPEIEEGKMGRGRQEREEGIISEERQERQEMLERSGNEITYTGETTLIQIPEGIEITIFQSEDESNIKIEELDVGDVIRIFYEEDEIIARISAHK